MSKKLKTKNFHLIKWKITKDGNKVILKTVIYKEYKAKFKKVDLFLIGCNPSNSAKYFNDDETNMYLRNKIEEKYNRDKEKRRKRWFSYLLMNLYNDVTSKANGKKFKINYGNIKNVCACLKLNKKTPALIFFGINHLSSFNNECCQCTEMLLDSIYCKGRKVDGTFIHNNFYHPLKWKTSFRIRKISRRFIKNQLTV